MIENSLLRAGIAGALWLAVAMAMALHPARAADVEVNIDNFTFAPQRITVEVGTTVTWHNEDDIPHTVASSAKLFKSKVLDTGEKFSFTFTTAGLYEYFCGLHPHMTGTVVVEGTTGRSAQQ
jgi:plastocyanin